MGDSFSSSSSLPWGATTSKTEGDKEEYEKVEFIVTGFGPFAGVAHNPTSVLCHQLVDYLKQREQDEELNESTNTTTTSRTITPRCLSQWTRTLIMETSAVAVQNCLTEIYKSFQTNNNNNNNNNNDSHTHKNKHKKKKIILHLGVHSSATNFHIESCAYNDATFAVPDEQGFQPCQQCVVDTRPMNDTLSTMFNVTSLVQVMNTDTSASTTSATTTATQKQPSRPLALVSTDPGRFVCNYTYCYSLDKFQCCSSSSSSSNNMDQDKESAAPATATAVPCCNNDTSKDHHDSSSRIVPTSIMPTTTTTTTSNIVRCLFLHVPPFSVISEPDQLAFIAKLMMALYQQFVNTSSSNIANS